MPKNLSGKRVAILVANGFEQVELTGPKQALEEVGAIAWSYAAALHLRLDPAVVFHAHGYRGGSESILENFREGRYIGVPFLRWIGLADDSYPRMARWLRE